MAVMILRGKSDGIIEDLVKVLEAYEANHPQAKIDLYRQSPVSVRIRIIDPDFAGKTKVKRSEEVWQYLEKAPEESVSDIFTVLLLTPDETERSWTNLEFEDPTPSEFWPSPVETETEH